MKIEIVPYTKDMEQAVKDFNQKLALKGSKFRFSESHISIWLPKIEGRRLFQEYFLAIDEMGIVRGAYILKHQDFFINGKIFSIGDLQFPLSEGIVTPEYSLIGVYLYEHAIRQKPSLYGLGMGSYATPIARMFKRAGWNFTVVPFYFKVLNAENFLRNISYLKTPLRKTLADIACFTRLGRISVVLMNAFSKKSKNDNIQVDEVREIGAWADDLWNRNSSGYSFAAVRDCGTLRILYPREDERFIRLKVEENGEIIGWVILLCTSMSHHKYFGEMRVGTIVDCFSKRGKEFEIVSAAVERLDREKADVIVSNQSCSTWGMALRMTGFLKGPSNFLLATSQALTKLMSPYEETVKRMHLNRGDGDGPINL